MYLNIYCQSFLFSVVKQFVILKLHPIFQSLGLNLCSVGWWFMLMRNTQNVMLKVTVWAVLEVAGELGVQTSILSTQIIYLSYTMIFDSLWIVRNYFMNIWCFLNCMLKHNCLEYEHKSSIPVQKRLNNRTSRYMKVFINDVFLVTHKQRLPLHRCRCQNVYFTGKER